MKSLFSPENVETLLGLFLVDLNDIEWQKWSWELTKQQGQWRSDNRNIYETILVMIIRKPQKMKQMNKKKMMNQIGLRKLWEKLILEKHSGNKYEKSSKSETGKQTHQTSANHANLSKFDYFVAKLLNLVCLNKFFLNVLVN